MLACSDQEEDAIANDKSFSYILKKYENQNTTNLLDVEKSKSYRLLNSFRINKDEFKLPATKLINKKQQVNQSTKSNIELTRLINESNRLINESNRLINKSTNLENGLNKSINVSTKLFNDPKKSSKNSTKLISKSSKLITEPSKQVNELSKLANKQIDHQTDFNQLINKSTNRFNNKTVSFKHPSLNETINKLNDDKLDETDDISSFNCDMPSELYSVVGDKKVFRLFNHIENVKDDNLSDSKLDQSKSFISNLEQINFLNSKLNQSKLTNSVRDQSKFQHFKLNSKLQNSKLNSKNQIKNKLTDHLQNYSKLNSTINSTNNSTKENFRITQPDESKFCNFLNQTKFDTLIDDEDHFYSIENDDFKILTESNNRINSLLNNESNYRLLIERSNKLINDESNALTSNRSNALNNNLADRLIENGSNSSSNHGLASNLSNNIENNQSSNLKNSQPTRTSLRFDSFINSSPDNCLKEIDCNFDENANSKDNSKNNLKDKDFNNSSLQSIAKYDLNKNFKKLNYEINGDLIAQDKNLTGYELFNNTKENHLNRVGSNSRINSLRSNYFASIQQNSRYETTLIKPDGESLDVFRDFSDNMAKLNETEPSYLKSLKKSIYENDLIKKHKTMNRNELTEKNITIDENKIINETKLMNESEQVPNLDDNISMNFSPIKPAVGVRGKFFKTPFKKPEIKSIGTANKKQLNDANEFISKEKMQSTFVDNGGGEKRSTFSLKSKLNEAEIEKNLEKELQKLKSNEKLSTDLTKRMKEQSKLDGNQFKKSDQINRTSLIILESKSKIEEFKRQQLEKNKSKERTSKPNDKTNFDSTLLNTRNESKLRNYELINKNREDNQSKRTLTKYVNNSRLEDKNSKSINNLNNKTETVDTSKLENEKFRLIEEELRLADLSNRNSKLGSRNLSTQSLQNVKDTLCNPSSKKDQSSKSDSSISRPEDILSLDDSNDRTLINLITKQKFSYLAYSKFLDTLLIKVKDLEDRNQLIKKRPTNKISNSKVTNQATISKSSTSLIKSNYLVRQLSNELTDLNKNSSNNALSKSEENSIETSNSLRSFNSTTISPSSIDDQMMNLNSILKSLTPNSNSEEKLNLSSIDKDEEYEDKFSNKLIRKNDATVNLNKKRVLEDLKERRSFKNDLDQNNSTSFNFGSTDSNTTTSNTKQETSFHCECCQRNKINFTNKTVQTQKLPVNSNLNNNLYLNQQESDQFDQFSRELDRLKNLQINQFKIEKKPNESKINNLESINGSATNNKQQLIHENDLETSFNLNNQALNEIFKSKCPRLFNSIQYRRNLIQKKMQKRKELDRIKKIELEKAALKTKQKMKKNLNKSLRSNITRPGIMNLRF